MKDGGEVNYQEGGEVNVPQFLRRPEDDMQEEEFKLQDVTQIDVEEPDPFPKRDRSVVAVSIVPSANVTSSVPKVLLIL